MHSGNHFSTPIRLPLMITMLIGIVGKPNVGKSTFFSAATMASAEIAAYPFTTIKPNKGVGYLRAPCPEKHFGVKCQPRNSACDNGTRLVPVELLDVAGLVPDAWQGKGLGNQFLDDLRQADAFIHIIDASGSTDSDGNPVPAGTHDPMVDVKFLENEIAHWMKGIIEKGFEKSARMAHLEGQKMEDVIHERLTGLGVPMPSICAALRESNMPANPMSWKDEEMLRLADNIRRLSKPILIAYNKSDVASDENLKRWRRCPIISPSPPAPRPNWRSRRPPKRSWSTTLPAKRRSRCPTRQSSHRRQRKAIDIMGNTMKRVGGTGVQTALEKAAFQLLDLIVVYPVEDETRLTDHAGNILPDAHLIRRGSTAKDLAYKIHTDLGEGFIRAINAKTKRIVGHDYVLQDGDVITIISRK